MITHWDIALIYINGRRSFGGDRPCSASAMVYLPALVSSTYKWLDSGYGPEAPGVLYRWVEQARA